MADPYSIPWATIATPATPTWPYANPTTNVDFTTAAAGVSSTSSYTSSASTPKSSLTRAADSDATGVIVGSVLGAIAASLVVILLAFLFLRYRRKKRTPPSAEFLAPRQSTSAFQLVPSGHDDVLPIYADGPHQTNPFYEKQRTSST